MPDAWNNREGPQAREPSKCLNRQSCKGKLAKEPSDHQLPEAQKKTDRAITPVAEAVHVPAHLVASGSPQPQQLCHLHCQPSWSRAATGGKKKSCIYAKQGCFIPFNPVNCGWPGISVSGVLQARILEWVATPFYSTIFPAAIATNSHEYLWPEPLWPR